MRIAVAVRGAAGARRRRLRGPVAGRHGPRHRRRPEVQAGRGLHRVRPGPLRARADHADRDSRAAVQGAGAREGVHGDAAPARAERRRDGRRGQRHGHPPRHRRRPADRCCVVNAHLDTVFPGRHRREGEAPGHAADRRRASATTRAGWRCCSRSSARWTRRSSRRRATSSSSATSAKKGEGDLRGIKYLLQEGPVQGPHQAGARDRRQRVERASRTAASAASGIA